MLFTVAQYFKSFLYVKFPWLELSHLEAQKLEHVPFSPYVCRPPFVEYPPFPISCYFAMGVSVFGATISPKVEIIFKNNILSQQYYLFLIFLPKLRGVFFFFFFGETISSHDLDFALSLLAIF